MGLVYYFISFKEINRLTLLEAASEISTFTQLTDGVLNIIRSTVDDKEVICN